MGQPRPKPRPKKSADGLCAEDGPPPPFHSWQAPPDGLFDVIVPKLTAKQFVVVQLVCKDWSRAARYCLKDATPKRPDVDLSKLVIRYPNLTQLNLTHVEGLSTRMLMPLRRLTALRELFLSNVALQHLQAANTDAAAAARVAAAGAGVGATAAAPAPKQLTSASPAQATTQLQSPSHWHVRSGSRAAAADARAASPTAVQSPQQLLGNGSPSVGAGAPITSAGIGGRAAAGAGATSPHRSRHGPASVATADTTAAAAPSSPSHRHKAPRLGTENRSPGGALAAQETGAPAEADGAGTAQVAAQGFEGTRSGALGPTAGSSPSSSSPPLSPASRIFGGLGDVLLRLSKLQADLCPALTADAIACLPNLTDLTLDTLVAPEALAPLGRLRCLAVKKLAKPEALDRLSGLTALLVNSDSSCASEFLPVCARLPGLQSLTFKTSSTKVLQQPDNMCWQGFSRLTSLDLRAPAEYLKPGLPTLAELPGLRSLSLDLYCASDEELMVTVVAPPNLESLFVSSDRSRSGGVIDVHPNPRLRSLRLRLYWTALNLVLPGGLPEPSPLPEPLSEDLDETPGRHQHDPTRFLNLGGATVSPRGPGRRAGAAAVDVGADSAGGAAAAAGGTGNRGRPGRSPHSSGRRPAVDSADGEEQRARCGRRRLCGGANRGVGSGDDDDSGTDTEEKADAEWGGAGDHRRGTPTRTPASGGGGAATGPPCRSHGRGVARRSGGTAAAASFETPVADHRPRHSVTPAASAGGAGSGSCYSGSGAVAATTATDGVGGIVQPPELELENLCLDACFFLLYGCLVPVLRQFPRLQSLTMDNCLALENGELGQLCELSSLREVSLSGLHLVTDSGLRALGRLPHLAALRVRGLRCKLAVHAAQTYVRQKPLVRRYEDVSGSFLTSLSSVTSLRSLALKHLHTAGEAALAAGLGGLSGLTRLEVKDVHSMSDRVLQRLTRHTGLQELCVLHCEAVTSRGRDVVVSALGQRVAMDFEGCSLPDITRPCALPTTSTQAQLIGDDQVSSSNQPRRSSQHSNQQ